MTQPKRPAKRAAQRPKTGPTSAKTAAEQGKQPAAKRTESASNVAKLVRKGRKLTAGAKLRRELSWPKADAAALTLITQAARTADRLEVLDRLLSGESNAWLAVKVGGVVVEVRVDGAVVEERQLSEVLRKLIGDIQKMKAVDTSGQPAGPASKDDPVVGVVADHYRKQRRA